MNRATRFYPTVPSPLSDIAIIGAGPAGATAAIGLARAGFNVTVYEQAQFPRDKVCGECLSALGLSVLARLRVDMPSDPNHFISLNRAILHAQDGSSLRLTLPAPMLGVARRVLDQRLLDVARTSGAEIRSPVRCERVRPSARPTIEFRDLRTNRADILAFDLILLADGKGAFLPRRPARTDDFGLKAHFRDVDGPSDAIELFGVAGHYGGIAPVGAGLTNVSFNVPRRRLSESRGDLDALFARMTAENPKLLDRMRRATRETEWLTSPLPRFSVRNHWPRHVIPIGNAAAALEPIGGEGMGLAMRSAEIATQEIIAAQADSRPVDVTALRRRFSRLWIPRRIGCRVAATLISSPRLASPLLAAANRFSAFPDAALRLIGKRENAAT